MRRAAPLWLGMILILVIAAPMLGCGKGKSSTTPVGDHETADFLMEIIGGDADGITMEKTPTDSGFAVTIKADVKDFTKTAIEVKYDATKVSPVNVERGDFAEDALYWQHTDYAGIVPISVALIGENPEPITETGTIATLQFKNEAFDGKSILVAPTEARVDLTADAISNPGQVDVSWTVELAADGNKDNVINGLDVFLLAAHFNHTSDYGGNTPTDSMDHCTDYNEDGNVNGQDLFLIASRFQHRYTQSHLRRSSDPNPLDDAILQSVPAKTDALADTVCGQTYDYVDTTFGATNYYVVTVADGGEPGANSDIFGPVNTALSCTANYSPKENLYPGTQINFTGFGVGGIPPYTWSWDLDGDGSEDSTLQNPSFTYGAIGDYDPELTIYDSSTPSQEATCNPGTITIEAVPDLSIQISTGSPLAVPFGTQVDFDAVTEPVGVTGILWQINDREPLVYDPMDQASFQMDEPGGNRVRAWCYLNDQMAVSNEIWVNAIDPNPNAGQIYLLPSGYMYGVGDAFTMDVTIGRSQPMHSCVFVYEYDEMMLRFDGFTLSPSDDRYPAGSVVNNLSTPGRVEIELILPDTSQPEEPMEAGLLGQLAFTAIGTGAQMFELGAYEAPTPPDEDGGGSRTRIWFEDRFMGFAWLGSNNFTVEVTEGPQAWPEVEVFSQPLMGTVQCGEVVNFIGLVYGGVSPYTVNWSLDPSDDPGNPVVLEGPVAAHSFPEDRFVDWTCSVGGVDSSLPTGITFNSNDYVYTNIAPDPLSITGIDLEFMPDTMEGAVMVNLNARGQGGCPEDVDCEFDIDWGDGTFTNIQGTKSLRIRDLHHFYGPGSYEITLTFSDDRGNVSDGPAPFVIDPSPTTEPDDGTFWLDSPDTSFGPNSTVRVNGYIEGPSFSYRGANIRVATAPDPVVHRTSGGQIATETPLWSPTAIYLSGSSEDLGENAPDDMYWISIGDVEITVPDNCHGATSDTEWVSQMNYLTTSNPGVSQLLFVVVEGESFTYFNDCTTANKHYASGYRSLVVNSD